MQEKTIETFCPTSRQEWRLWLKQNHSSKQSVWLIYYKKKANVASITYNEAVDEALCFGWMTAQGSLLTMKRLCNFSVNENHIVFGQR
ncbi:YdeI/OmpD-associated family protein [Arcticibacter svalbardensis]|uniref:YdeI/OmpD-associated family protein n=1 Tax=Arcticibacter svalbardensis TaxID=1288027 RepID=UPI001F19E848|nr:hypothetical protein [Arcticibacter svalbardensis]